ncbi:UNVERIFIED_CONTAM: hypothetical protein K2H54_055095, partial [Gekko kuhli]
MQYYEIIGLDPMEKKPTCKVGGNLPLLGQPFSSSLVLLLEDSYLPGSAFQAGGR